MTYTPDYISELAPNEVFVFGSNLDGYHGGGAARTALNKFGAQWGQGVGLQGQSYAIPTMHGPVETIAPYVDEFIQFAKEHTELTFLVTPIGCGIAGFEPQDIAPLFRKALNVENIKLPKSFHEVLGKSNIPYLVPKAIISQYYGKVRTLIDLAKALNEEKHYTDIDAFITDFKQTIQEYMQSGLIDEYSYSIFFRTCIVPFFATGRIDIDENELFSHIQNDNTIQSVFIKRGLSKLLRIIYYLNESQRYTTAHQIQDHIRQLFPGLSHCSNSTTKTPDVSMGFINQYIDIHNAIIDQWENLIDNNGALSNQKLEKYFFTDFEDLLDEHGLIKTLDKFYGTNFCTHEHLFYPESIQAPKYIEIPTGGCHAIYAKACGGNGETNIPDYYEFHFVKNIIISCGKYEEIDEFLIPKEDYSLPIYNRDYGKVLFESKRKKHAFILNYKCDAKVDPHTCWSKDIDRSYPWM